MIMEERTLCVIKPNAVAARKIGAIVGRFEDAGLRIDALRLAALRREQAEAFYAEHAGKPFFARLVAFMTSGPVVAMAIAGDGAVARCREIMGATDPAAAAPGTIRALYGANMTENAVHGSDSPASAAREIAFYFPEL
jgi:nucleoside-diphosphate kinase